MNRKDRREPPKPPPGPAALRFSPAVLQAYKEGDRAVADGRLEDAAASYRAAIGLKPDFPEAHYNLGLVLRRLGHLSQAVAAYQQAIALKPRLFAAHFNLGNVLHDLDRPGDAVASYRRALALDAADPELHNKLAWALQRLGRTDDAVAAYRQALALKPDLPEAVSALTFMRMERCDWQDLARDEDKCRALVRSGAPDINPFIFQFLPSSAAEQLLCARQQARSLMGNIGRLPARTAQPKDKLRLGYLSWDFREHNVAHLVVELLERHDRNRFEIAGYSIGPADSSAIRRRLQAAFDRFDDIRPLSDAEAARKIRADGIDILVDLNGYTWGGRPSILAWRPAPVQVNFLGFFGTMGSAAFDYVIADATSLPMTDQPFVDERIVHLPDCCQPSDTTRAIPERTPSRAECGLPDAGFVFCCFNNSYKLAPPVFDVWMRLLRAVPGSVLWLLDAGPQMRTNLGRETAARGVPAERVVFAPRLPLPDHLARCRRADLFLDTLPANAHTTMSDTLWAGLPVLTCAGDTFAGRIAASQLRAIGLPALVTHSLNEYEALALRLANDPGELSALRRRLDDNRRAAPLFDMPRFARALEAAYARMWDIAAAGQQPQPFSVAREPSIGNIG